MNVESFSSQHLQVSGINTSNLAAEHIEVQPYVPATYVGRRTEWNKPIYHSQLERKFNSTTCKHQWLGNDEKRNCTAPRVSVILWLTPAKRLLKPLHSHFDSDVNLHWCVCQPTWTWSHSFRRLISFSIHPIYDEIVCSLRIPLARRYLMKAPGHLFLCAAGAASAQAEPKYQLLNKRIKCLFLVVKSHGSLIWMGTVILAPGAQP